MKSTITFTATVALDKGGSITVAVDEVPIAGADLFNLVETMFEQVPPGIVAAMGMGSTSLIPREGPPPRPHQAIEDLAALGCTDPIGFLLTETMVRTADAHAYQREAERRGVLAL